MAADKPAAIPWQSLCQQENNRYQRPKGPRQELVAAFSASCGNSCRPYRTIGLASLTNDQPLPGALAGLNFDAASWTRCSTSHQRVYARLRRAMAKWRTAEPGQELEKPESFPVRLS
ncbi:MAG: hypothetical protein OJF62_000375 [Pseudolabrys sp.]|nr:hypothetical protein [Pseudolabrys sp.]